MVLKAARKRDVHSTGVHRMNVCHIDIEFVCSLVVSRKSHSLFGFLGALGGTTEMAVRRTLERGRGV